MSQRLPLDHDEMARLTSGRDMWSTAPWPEAGVRSIRMADGPMGISSGRVDERDVSVLTPCGHALGASWDVDLVRRVGSTVGNEARRLGVDALLAPNLNLPRSPLVGRGFEMYAEDPMLAGALGSAWIDGVASQGAGCVAKHLVCNDSETARDVMSAVIDDAALHEIYLRPFEMAAQRPGCVGVMAAYNRLNGIYCAEHRELLDGIVYRGGRRSGRRGRRSRDVSAARLTVTDPAAADHAWSAVAAGHVAALAKADAPDAIFVGAGPDGRDLAGAVSALTGLGVLVNATAVTWADGGPAVEMSVFGGKLLTTSGFTGGRGIVTVRPNVTTAAPAASPGRIEARDVEPARTLPAVRVVDRVSEAGAAAPIEEARIIVAGGRGVGGPDGFGIVEQLAEALGGAVGATRAAVDSGWIPV